MLRLVARVSVVLLLAVAELGLASLASEVAPARAQAVGSIQG
jgi:hypothetical protein